MVTYVSQYVCEIDYLWWCSSSLLCVITWQFLEMFCNIEFQFGAVVNNVRMNFIACVLGACYFYWVHIWGWDFGSLHAKHLFSFSRKCQAVSDMFGKFLCKLGTVYNSLGFALLPALGSVSLFNFCHFGEYCGILALICILLITYEVKTLLHVVFGHWNILFCDVSGYISCPFSTELSSFVFMICTSYFIFLIWDFSYQCCIFYPVDCLFIVLRVFVCLLLNWTEVFNIFNISTVKFLSTFCILFMKSN